MGFGHIETAANIAPLQRQVRDVGWSADADLMAPNQEFLGGWAYIGSYWTKTVQAVSRGVSGSLYIILGMAGTQYRIGRTGTYYQTRLAPGTFSTFTFTEAARYIRPIYRRGATGGYFTLTGLFQT